MSARIAVAKRSARIERVLRENAGDAAGVLSVPLSALVADGSYDRPLALELETLARDAALRWPLRRIAALMLETALVRIESTDPKERRFWIRRFGIGAGSDGRAELERQGYAHGEPLECQVWRRLERMRRIHRLIDSAGTSDRALEDFLDAASRECRLTFGRWLFTSDEVLAEIERGVRRSSGLRDPHRHGQFVSEAARAIDKLPEMERSLVEALCRNGVIRWAALNTTSEINSLIEQPVGTVVLTVKPPGSTEEIEIKRAGLVRDLPLAVVWERKNYILPSSHHLDGGSMHQLLMYEAENSAFFSRVFREVHGFDASMSRTVYMATVHTISTPRGEVHILDYFTDPRVFGESYETMRWHMYHVVKTLAEYARDPFEEPANDVALTGAFIGRVKPAQAIQLGTTAFRLERLKRYLSPTGADRYFGPDGLNVAHDSDDKRRFADALLDEILGVYEPPHVTWRSHAQYVEAAFRVPANRKRANDNYVHLLEQVGRFWGTLLGIRGHTQGESFVERNAGIRSVWADGRWQVRMVFMDHDSMSFASVGTPTYRPRDSVMHAAKDGKHVLGGIYGKNFRVRGQLWFLREIYRVGSSVERRGVAAFRAEMKRAYDATHEAIRTNPVLGRMFHAPFIEKIRDWDEIVSAYMKTPKTTSARNAWRAASRALLTKKGYREDVADEHVATVTKQARFLRRLSFLF